jgi:hypothetical protein
LKEWKNHIQSLIYKLEKVVEKWAAVNIFHFYIMKRYKAGDELNKLILSMF